MGRQYWLFEKNGWLFRWRNRLEKIPSSKGVICNN